MHTFETKQKIVIYYLTLLFAPQRGFTTWLMLTNPGTCRACCWNPGHKNYTEKTMFPFTFTLNGI